MTRINTNVSSLTAQTRLQRTNNDLNTALTRLSTGLRINSGKDDPAGLIASESLRSDITSINKALSNTQRAGQIIATADSALGQVSSLLNDVRGLVTEAANKGALSDSEIEANQLQVDSSLEAINRIAQTTTFQGRKLLDGSLDFVTKPGTGFSTVSDLQIEQANLGATGGVGISVNISSAATRASITTDGIASSATVAAKSKVDIDFGTSGAATQGTIEVELDDSYLVGAEASRTVRLANAVTNAASGAEASGTLTIANGLSLKLAVRDGSIRDGITGNDIEVKLNTITSGASNGSFNSGTGVLTLNLREGQSGAELETDLANDADLNQVFQFSNGSSKTSAIRTLTTDTSALAIKLTAVAGEALDGAIANSLKVVVTTSATASSTAATYDANANQLNVTLETGLNAATLQTALGGTAAASVLGFAVTGAGNTAAGDTGTYAEGSGISTGTSGVGEIVRSTFATTGNLTGVLSGGTATLAGATDLFTLTAVDGGLADGARGSSTKIEFTTTTGTQDATYDYDSNKITVSVQANDTVASIYSLINTKLAGKFVATNLAAPTSGYKYASADNGTLSGNFSAVTDTVTTSKFQLKAVSGSALDGTTINSTKLNFIAGTTSSSSAKYDADSNVLNVTVGTKNTVDQVLAAITADEGTKFQVLAPATGGASLFSLDAVSAANDDFGSTTPTSIVSGTAYDGKLTVQAKENGAAFDKTIKFQKANIAANTATAAIVSGNIVVTVSDQGDGLVSLSKIAEAINTLDDFTATYDDSGFTGDKKLNVLSETIPALTAVSLTGGSDGGGLSDDLSFALTGTDGNQSFEFIKGSSLSTIISGINNFKDATGVEAIDDGGKLKLSSTKYGSKSTVAIEFLNGKTGGAFQTNLSGTRANGTDIAASVNGFAATGDGNTLSVSTSSLSLSLTVNDGSTTAVNFDITGGGALFQLGGDVVSNQQARLGIGSLSTAKLGGTSGRLFELGKGKSKSLSNDISGAANVIDEVINKVTGLRGRLGAFQRTTLESNSVSLNDTLANLNEAQSSIRDADFAKESANLTRAQILVQSGTSVLGIANQSSQSVLSLLR